MKRKVNTDGQVGWIAWSSLIIYMGALFVIIRGALDNAFDSEIGVAAVAAAATAVARVSEIRKDYRDF